MASISNSEVLKVLQDRSTNIPAAALERGSP